MIALHDCSAFNIHQDSSVIDEEGSGMDDFGEMQIICIFFEKKLSLI